MGSSKRMSLMSVAFPKHVPLGVALVEAAVDDCERYGVAVLQQQQGGHGQRFVEGAGHGREVGAGVVTVGQLGGEEEIGVDLGGLNGGGIVEKVAEEVSSASVN